MNAAQKYEEALMIIHETPPPKPFNPNYDPKASARYEKVTKSMVADNYYANHTRAECKEEWRRRYEKLQEEGQ